MENHQQGRLVERNITNTNTASAGTGRSIHQAMKLSNITQPTNSSMRPLTIYKDGGLRYACFEALCPNAERGCREAVWLEHRQLLAEREDMDDIIHAIERIHEHRLDFKPAAVNKGG